MFTYACHQSYIDRDSGQPMIAHVADYIRLQDGPEVYFIQQGQVYEHGAGLPVPPDLLPEWFWPAVRVLTPQARQAVGFTLPEDKINSIAQVPQEIRDLLAGLPDHIRAALLSQALRMPQVETSPPGEYEDKGEAPAALKTDPEAPRPKMWTCDQCPEEVPLARKGIHLASHARTQKRLLKAGL